MFLLMYCLHLDRRDWFASFIGKSILPVILIKNRKSFLAFIQNVENNDYDIQYFSGLLAVLFRQTNIIWVAFVAAQSIGPYFIHTIHCAQIEQTNQQTPAKFSLTTTGQFWEVSFSFIYYLVISYQ